MFYISHVFGLFLIKIIIIIIMLMAAPVRNGCIVISPCLGHVSPLPWRRFVFVWASFYSFYAGDVWDNQIVYRKSFTDNQTINSWTTVFHSNSNAYFYASPSSGEAYRDRQLTTNFEFWVHVSMWGFQNRVCPSVCLSVCLSVCPSVCLSVCLSVHLSVPREKKSP